MSGPAVTFGDAAAAFIELLDTELPAPFDDVTITDQVPETRPSRFVVVQRVGGTVESLITEKPHLVFECYDRKSYDDAHDLAQACRTVARAAARSQVGDIRCYGIEEIAGPAPLPDPISKMPRYTFTLAPLVRGVPA